MTRWMQERMSAVRHGYAWWLGALSDLLAAPLARARPWRILIRRSEDGLEIAENRNGVAVILATGATAKAGLPPQASAAIHAASRSAARIMLRLSPDEVLERTIQIPKAASDVIAPVLHNQMNRIVPWPREETRYGFEVADDGHHAPDQMDIRIVATTQSVLDEALAGAHALGIAPSVIDFAGRDAAGPGIELLSLEPDPRLRIARRLHLAFVSLLTASLAIGGLGAYQCWQAASESRDLESRIGAARMRLAEMSRQNAGDARLRQALEQLIGRRGSEPAMVVLIDALSRALPDSAHLTELEIRGRQARILGKSDDATALIADIEGAPQFDSVRFAAPTTREAEERLESFAITARIAGPSAQEKDAHDEQ
jgi:general secretion pathway protein L